jgi:ABC-2 type transport system ATP-binding protein
MVDLSGAAGRRAGGYSLGMRQRLAIAAALLGDPEALILDEPANGLDPQGMRWLRDLLRSLAAEGRTVLVSSHVLAEMQQTAHDVVIIGRGRLVASGSVEELSAQGTQTRVRTPDSARLVAALAAKGMESRPAEDGVLLVTAVPELVGEVAAAEGVTLHELVADRQSLEEAFFALTGEEEG